MNYETYLFARLEKQADRQIKEQNGDPQDHISLDIPLFIRILELAREDIKSDPELHKMVERVITLKDQGILTMNDYDNIAGKAIVPVDDPKKIDGIDELRKLAGIR